MIGIYAITHTNSGRVYVGSSASIDRRFKEHIIQLRCGKHHNQHLQRAWNLYGKEAFVFSVLEALDSTDILIKREKHHADNIELLYNSGSFVESSFRGATHSDTTRLKISEYAKTRTYSPETRARMSEAKKGKQRPAFTDIHRARMSAVKKADWKSRSVLLTHTTPHTAEAKARMSASQKAAWVRRKAVA